MKADKNMLLITSYWGKYDTVKMIPISNDCPYSEVIYDPATTLLVVISKIQKENFQMVPRLDDDGNEILSKKPRQNGKKIKETRSRLNTLQEYYIIEKDEQIDFIYRFAINAETYDFMKYMRDVKQEMAEAAAATAKPAGKPEMALVDAKGKPLASKKGKKN
jgi:hypothetical protein